MVEATIEDLAWLSLFLRASVWKRTASMYWAC